MSPLLFLCGRTFPCHFQFSSKNPQAGSPDAVFAGNPSLPTRTDSADFKNTIEKYKKSSDFLLITYFF